MNHLKKCIKYEKFWQYLYIKFFYILEATIVTLW